MYISVLTWLQLQAVALERGLNVQCGHVCPLLCNGLCWTVRKLRVENRVCVEEVLLCVGPEVSPGWKCDIHIVQAG
jgi:hypothetical protein